MGSRDDCTRSIASSFTARLLISCQHIASADPSDHPIIDPHYLDNETDMDVMVEGYKFNRRVCQSEPFRNYVLQELVPGPAIQSDAEIRGRSRHTRTVAVYCSRFAHRVHQEGCQVDMAYELFCCQGITGLMRSSADGCGSCSMLPHEKGGVVDSNLKVYGTKNLRVVDLSILPLEVSANTQCKPPVNVVAAFSLMQTFTAVVYGIAEQG